MRSVILALALAVSSVAAQAGEPATYELHGETFDGYRAKASGESKGLVLIIHDWDGLTGYEMKRADMLAAMGYDAFAVDLFGKGNRPTEIAAKKKKTAGFIRTRRGCAVSCSPGSKRRARPVTARPW
jgi:dienelactone hydrolase